MIPRLLSLLVYAVAVAAQTAPSFHGQQVIVTPGQTSRAENASLSAAKVCLTPSGICFTAPSGTPPFGLAPKATVVQLNASQQALLFTATGSGGGSGTVKLLALLDVRSGRLDNLSPGVSISEQGEYALWQEGSVSNFTLLMTADYVWGAGEAHFTPHRYRVSAYVMGPLATGTEPRQYFLQDEYLTNSKYPPPGQPNSSVILDHERPEVLSRLHRQR